MNKMSVSGTSGQGRRRGAGDVLYSSHNQRHTCCLSTRVLLHHGPVSYLLGYARVSTVDQNPDPQID